MAARNAACLSGYEQRVPQAELGGDLVNAPAIRDHWSSGRMSAL
ncbi:MAG TPA: hypothetical protein VNT27_12800 [Propionibacteriaceae bacterium]|nr:hypothetical protein [Propionibacteriaceae bacterium]